MTSDQSSQFLNNLITYFTELFILLKRRQEHMLWWFLLLHVYKTRYMIDSLIPVTNSVCYTSNSRAIRRYVLPQLFNQADDDQIWSLICPIHWACYSWYTRIDIIVTFVSENFDMLTYFDTAKNNPPLFIGDHTKQPTQMFGFIVMRIVFIQQKKCIAHTL